MEHREALKKLIPMSDDEVENIPPRELKLSTSNLMDTSSLLDSPVKTTYGDFSLNSFVVVDVPSQEPEASQEDGVDVYMESILGLFKSLNSKIDDLAHQRSAERQVLDEAQQCLLSNNSKKALDIISSHSGKCIPDVKKAVCDFLERQWPEFLLNIRSCLVSTQEICFNLKNAYKDTESKLFKKLEENDRLKNIINQQSIDCRAQIDALASENNAMKDGVIKLIRDLDPDLRLGSQLEEDVLKELEVLIARKNEVIDDLRTESARKDNIIHEYTRKAKSFEISHLHSQIEELKATQKKLQDENLNLTQILNKMSEKNTKLKQELVHFNSELRKSLESINKKNDTIARQKTLIEMFQEKLSGSQNLPIEELRRRRCEIDDKLARETDYFAKQSLRREREDCEKRLSDFLSLSSRKKA